MHFSLAFSPFSLDTENGCRTSLMLMVKLMVMVVMLLLLPLQEKRVLAVQRRVMPTGKHVPWRTAWWWWWWQCSHERIDRSATNEAPHCCSFHQQHFPIGSLSTSTGRPLLLLLMMTTFTFSCSSSSHLHCFSFHCHTQTVPFLLLSLTHEKLLFSV